MISDVHAKEVHDGWRQLSGFSTGAERARLARLGALAFELINKVFQVIVGVIRNHPRNRAYFWTRWC